MTKPLCSSVVIVALAMLFCAPSYALSPKQHGELAQLALDHHIRPSYQLLASATDELNKGLAGFCTKPSKAARAKIEPLFVKALLSWSRIDHIRFGPIAKQDRISRFVFWPDHKNIGLRQVKKALRSRNRQVINLQKLQNKSVALQGFTALEYLLYGKGFEDISKPSRRGKFRCAYAKTIAKNLAGMSEKLVNEWQPGKKYTQIFLHPREDSDIYQTPKEVTLALFLSFTTELKIVHFLKLGRPLGKSLKKARPKRAAFWRSKQAFAVMDANMEGNRALFNKVFSNPVANSDPGTEEGVDLDFEQVHQELLSMQYPIIDAVRNEARRAALKNLQTTIDQIKKEAGRAIIRAADLSMGFNALDGD